MTNARHEEIIDSLGEQTTDLCHLHDHITRVIANFDIDEEWFSDYDDPDRAKFKLKPVVLMFLYYHARDLNSESELERRLKGAAYVYVRFGLSQPLDQQIINYNWKEWFTLEERRTIKKAAERIREICAEHDVIETGEPALDPDDIQDRDIAEEQIMRAVRLATELSFDEFIDPRGPNITYELQAYFERQGYLNMARAGTTTLRRRFARLSDRPKVPHGSSHNRTMKKVADPDPQTDLWDYTNGNGVPMWRRIRDTILPVFHRSIEKQLDEIAGRDRQGIRQPVAAAIDITYWDFWGLPFKDEEDVEWWEEPVVIERSDGTTREVYPKEDYPEMVSGLKESHERGYKFATITIIAQDTPIVLGIEPVRDYRQWERREKDAVETTSRLDLVERLVQQTEQHVDIHKVFCDREFDVHGIRDFLDRRNIQYVIGKQKRSTADYENIEEIAEDPVYDHRIEHAELTYEGRTHEVSIIYLPTDGEDDEYSMFTVNGHVGPDRAQALLSQYRQRWEIENGYKSIKKHFLPTTATTDYRTRFLFFVIGVMLYNVWRLTNFVLRDEVDVDLGEDPPILAGEIVELMGFCLFDPGD